MYEMKDVKKREKNPPSPFRERGVYVYRSQGAVLLLFLHLIPGILVEPPDAENHRKKE